ncbi:hypothetical protein D3C74_241490 [compost metagenome]
MKKAQIKTTVKLIPHPDPHVLSICDADRPKRDIEARGRGNCIRKTYIKLSKGLSNSLGFTWKALG